MDDSKMLVVIPTYSSWEYTVDAVRSGIENTPNADFLIVDDCSPDFFEKRHMLVDALTERTWLYRFDTNAGMTRSWNYGLAKAVDMRYKYCCVTNSDVLFPTGWDVSLRGVADLGFIAGPLSNAPGNTFALQNIDQHIPDYKLTDDAAELDALSYRLQAATSGTVDKRIPAPAVNGFCMLALTTTWNRVRYSTDCVFDPAKPMAGNEDELQKRASRIGVASAVALGSFVFHYRSVTRGMRHVKGRWLRKPDSKSISSDV